MAVNPLVSIIIVNWNGLGILKDCLSTLVRVNYKDLEIIVVDNGSVDGSIEFLEEFKFRGEEIILIKNSNNLGFAIANNQGFEKAKGAYILLLNNDTKVEPNFLSLLVKKLESEPQVGVIQPKIFIMDKKDYLDNVGSYLTRLGFLQHVGFMEKDSSIYNTERIIFSAKGACMLIKREVIEKVGLFDCDFGSYFEESDFCWRVWLAGWKVMFYPEAKIYHKVGFSSKRQNQIFVNYHSNKNRICTLIKNLNITNLFLIVSAHLLINLGLSLFYLIKLQLAKSWMIWKAILWNIWFLPKTLIKRSQVQKLRRVSDEFLFQDILKNINLINMWKHFLKVEANFK